MKHGTVAHSLAQRPIAPAEGNGTFAAHRCKGLHDLRESGAYVTGAGKTPIEAL